MHIYRAAAWHENCDPFVVVTATTAQTCSNLLRDAVLAEAEHCLEYYDNLNPDIRSAGPYSVVDESLTDEQQHELHTAGFYID